MTMQPLRIVNIGSSFAAGPGIPPQPERFIGRSGSNYAGVLLRRLSFTPASRILFPSSSSPVETVTETEQAKLTDLSVGGATLLNLLSAAQTFPLTKKHIPAQIPRIPPEADIVLVLGGGNDINYILDLLVESLEAYRLFRVTRSIWRGFSVVFGTFAHVTRRALGRSSAPTTTTTTDEDDLGRFAAQGDLAQQEDALARRYGEVLDAIHARAPEALVVLVHYVTLFGPHAQPVVNVPLPSEEVIAKYRDIGDRTVRAGERAARVGERQEWCIEIPVAEASREHGVGSPDPWVVGWDLMEFVRGRFSVYHPNARGMQAVAEMIWDALREKGKVEGEWVLEKA